MNAGLFHDPALREEGPLPLPHAAEVELAAGVRLCPFHQRHDGAFLRGSEGLMECMGSRVAQ
eukprot:11179420-Lingulodinium_polyedra.AAC.1